MAHLVAKGRIVFFCSLVALCSQANAETGDKVFVFSISEKHAAEALNQFARQTGVVLLYPYAEVRDKTVNPVIGEYPMMEALELLLKGSGLASGLTNKGTIKITVDRDIQQDHGKSGMNNEKNFGKALTAALVSIFGVSEAALSQDGVVGTRGIEEIIVTANKRSENIQDVPISLAVITGDSLKSLGVTSANQLEVTTPALKIGTTVSVPQVYIRGMGTSNLNSEGTVGLYLDGVYLPYPPSISQSFLDIERVEILKGPQGTLYGRNTTAGAINFITRDPSARQAMELQATVGTWGTRNFSGYLSSGPGKVSASLAGQISKHDAFLENLANGPDYNDKDEYGLRGKLKFELGEAWTADIAADYTKRDDYGAVGFLQLYERPTAADPALNGQSSTTSRPRKTYTDFPSDGHEYESYGGSLNIRGELPFADFASITGYRKTSVHTSPDADASNLPLTAFSSTSEFENWSQEFQFISNGEGPLEWIAGLYAFDLDGGIGPTGVWFMGNTGGPDLNSADLIVNGFGRSRAYAAYGQAGYSLTEQFKVTLGMRYSWEKRYLDVQTVAVPGFGVVMMDQPDSKSWNSLDPKIGIEYSWDDHLLYANFTQGFRSGSYNLGSPGDPGPVNPEEVDAFEIGGKHILANTLVFNWALFHYDYEDLQVSREVNDGSGGLFSNQNAASARSRGGEVSLDVSPTERLRFNLGIGYTDARYESFKDASAFLPIPGGYGVQQLSVDVSGKQLARAPEWTASSQINYTLPVADDSIDLAANVYYTSGYFLDTPSGIRQGGFSLVNLRATYRLPGDNISVSVFSNNVFNKFYIDSVSTNAFGYIAMASDPRITGVTLSLSY